MLVTLNGQNYYLNITNTRTLDIANLANNTYPISAHYVGDSNYNSRITSGELKVFKVSDYVFDINATNVNGTIVIEIELPEDAKGNVTVNINGNETIIKPGENLNVTGLKPGNYTVNATYSGDDKYNPSNTTTKEVIIPKIIDYTLVIDAVNMSIGNTGTIIVTVPRNATGNITITVNTKSSSVKIVDGVARLDIENVRVDSYTVYAYYEGDDYYGEHTNSSAFRVDPVETNLTIIAYDLIYGDDIVIKVNVTGLTDIVSLPTGDIVLKVGGMTYVNEIIDGVATFNVDTLPVNEYNISAYYRGDLNYLGNSTWKVFNIDRIGDYTFDGTIVEDNRTVVITLDYPDDLTGNVTIVIDGNDTRSVPLNHTINITDLIPGKHNINVTYPGDDRHYPSDSIIDDVTIIKRDEFDVIIGVDDIVYGDDETITVTLPEAATGYVLITVNGKTTNKTLVNGKTNITVSGLLVNNYPVYVTYSGDSVYTGKGNLANFNVIKANRTIDVSIEDINVGDDLIINVNVNATGTVRVNIGDVERFGVLSNNVTTIVISGFANATYTAVVTYLGDDNYNVNTTNATFKVYKVDSYPYEYNVTVKNSTVVVDIDLPDDAKGNMTIIIDGENKTVPVTDQYNITDLVPGNHTIVVIYDGDDKYTNSSNKTVVITIPRVENCPVIINVTDIVFRDSETIIVNVPLNATGSVNITINGKTTNVPITGGRASLVVDGLGAGTYPVSVVYNGNWIYSVSSNASNFRVSKLGDYEHSLVATPNQTSRDVRLSEKLPADATGNATIIVDGIEYATVNVTNGYVNITLIALEPGSHTISVRYNGNNNYTAVTDTKTVNINKISSYTIDVTAEDIIVGQNTDIDITLPGDVTATVTVTIDGVKYSADVVNGKGTLRISGIAKGNHSVVLSFAGNNRYVSGQDTDSFIAVAPRTIIAIDVGTDKATFTLPSDINGRLTVNIDGKSSNVTITNGKATADLLTWLQEPIQYLLAMQEIHTTLQDLTLQQ